MEITQLHLKHFGKFTDYRLDLHAGINIISGGNETGKSTLHAFIRAMLYGITRTRSKSLDEYQLREPWENPAFFAGSMKLLHEGKIYRIDRNFYRREERLEVICETDGAKAKDPEEAIRLFTGGLTGEDFDNTVYIRQAQPATGKELGERLKSCLVNMEYASDDSVDITAAAEYLKKKRKRAENEKRAALERIEGQIRSKTQESEYVTRDLERLVEKRMREEAAKEETVPFERVKADGQMPDTLENGPAPGAGTRKEEAGSAGDPERAEEYGPDVKPETEGDLEQPEEPEEAEETDGVLLPAAMFLSFITAVLMCVCAYLTTDHRMRYAAAAGAALVTIVALGLLRRILHPVSKAERIRRRVMREQFLDRHLGFRDDGNDPVVRQEAVRRGQRARDQILRAKEEEEEKRRDLEEKSHRQLKRALELQEKEDRRQRGLDVERIARTQVLERESSLRRQKLDELKEELEGLYRKKAEVSSDDEEIRALAMAQDRIRDLSGSIYRETGADFESEVSVLLSALTDGLYTRISLDDRNAVLLNTPQRLLTPEQVSCGTMQQVYFALRLASSHLLSRDSSVPLILDEPFAMFDDKRLEHALRVLSGSGRQVILFSCQTRELDLLSRMGLA